MTETPIVELVVEALRARAEQRTRAGGLLAQKLVDAKAQGVDVRSKAMRVVEELAAAARLTDTAARLEDGTWTLRATSALGEATATEDVDRPMTDTETGTLEVVPGVGEVELIDDEDAPLSPDDRAAIDAAFDQALEGVSP